VAWGESNAVVFANSVLGARTERYGDFMDICAAVTGRAPAVGLHLDEGRRPTIAFSVSDLGDWLEEDVGYALIGFVVGRLAGTKVPLIVGLRGDTSEEQLKALVATAASSGSVAMFHAAGITPEAPPEVPTGLDMVRIDVPEHWHCVLVHPDQVLETRRAREALAGAYGLGEFVAQSANLAQMLVGCMRGDEALVRAGFADVLVEPRRAPLIPGFAQVKQAALDAGALGASISGAGPSVFAWFTDKLAAEAAVKPMQAAFAQAGFPSQAYVSPVAGPRAEVL